MIIISNYHLKQNIIVNHLGINRQITIALFSYAFLSFMSSISIVVISIEPFLIVLHLHAFKYIAMDITTTVKTSSVKSAHKELIGAMKICSL